MWFPWPGVYVCMCVSGYEFYYSSKIDSGPKAQASTHLQFQNGGEKRKNEEEGGEKWIGCREKIEGERGPKERRREEENESELIQSSSTLQAFASGFLFKRRGRWEDVEGTERGRSVAGKERGGNVHDSSSFSPLLSPSHSFLLLSFPNCSEKIKLFTSAKHG